MKRSEAFWVLNEMYELANEAQKQALNIAQRDIEFVDLMPDVPVQRWIPVTERLPKSSDQTVMIARSYRGKRYVEIGAIFANGEACCYSDEYKINRREHLVTNWMPLPEPPKEDAE